MLGSVGEGQLAGGVVTSAIKRTESYFFGSRDARSAKERSSSIENTIDKKKYFSSSVKKKNARFEPNEAWCHPKTTRHVLGQLVSLPYPSRLLATTNVRVHANTLDIVQPNIGSVEYRRRAEQGQAKKF